MWGFITSLNDILIPHLKGIFELNYTQTMLIQFTFFGAYFLVSLPSGWIVKRIGYKIGIVIGLIMTGIGALLFYPASIIIDYRLFLLALFVLASGITILQVAANPYVAILGKPETASSRLNMTQAFNSLGTTIAPLLGGLLILNADVSTALDEGQSVQMPYIGIALTLFAIALVFVFVKLPEIELESYKKEAGNALAFKHLVLGAVAIFMYVGAEVAIGSFMINYLGEPSIAGFSESEAAQYVALYWGGAMIGRFFGAILLSEMKNISLKYMYIGAILVFAVLLSYFITSLWMDSLIFMIFVLLNLGAFFIGKGKSNKTLTVFSLSIVILIMITVFASGALAMWTIIAIGLFNSIMFPTIFTLGISGLGKHTSQGSGILVLAIVGGAILPLIMGMMADWIGIQASFSITLVAYLYIAYYGISGYKHALIKKTKENK